MLQSSHASILVAFVVNAALTIHIIVRDGFIWTNTLLFLLYYLVPYNIEYDEREISNIRSQCECDNCGDSGHPHQVSTTEVYPDNPNGLILLDQKNKTKSSLVWGEDITFLDHRQHANGGGEMADSPRYSQISEIVDQDNKSILQRELQQCDNGNNKLELTTNMVTLSELSDMNVMEPDKYISLSGFNFFPKDEGTEDLNDICSSLDLVDHNLVETHPCTVDEIHHSNVPTTSTSENPSPPVGRMNLRRTRTASRRMSALNGDDNSFCSQSEGMSESNRKRNMSEHSMMSACSYDDPDSPYNSSGRKKRRRYEEAPSEDPAFEKSRKNAIIAKRNREKKKALMDDMEKRCDKLVYDNQQLEFDNGKLRHRVTTLEEEVYYLKSVLANESALSTVLSGLKSVGHLRFSSSFDASKNNKKPGSSKNSPTSSPLKVSGGVCLHVDGNEVCMQTCAKCSKVYFLNFKLQLAQTKFVLFLFK